MRFDVLTLFPSMFDSYVGQSLLKKAIDGGLVSVATHDIRNWSRDKHHKVDDRPFGGGPGMVLRVEPVVECVEAVQQMPWKGGPGSPESQAQPGHLIVLSPRGRTLNQQVVEELVGKSRLLLLCGRYEGFDQRVFDILQPDEISLGDYILSGGEVAAMAVIDAVIRLVPGVLGDDASSQNDSFSEQPGGERRMLEFAQYTRPREFRGHEVPEVLLNGNHHQIERWRVEQSYLTTRKRRVDLLERRDLLKQSETQSEEEHRKE